MSDSEVTFGHRDMLALGASRTTTDEPGTLTAEQLAERLRTVNPGVPVRVANRGELVEVFVVGDWRGYASLGVDGRWYID